LFIYYTFVLPSTKVKT